MKAEGNVRETISGLEVEAMRRDRGVENRRNL